MPRQPTDSPTSLLTIADFATRLGVSRSRGYQLAARLPAGVRVHYGRRIYLDAARLAALEAAGGVRRLRPEARHGA